MASPCGGRVRGWLLPVEGGEGVASPCGGRVRGWLLPVEGG